MREIMDLVITSVDDEQVTNFATVDIPTVLGAVQRYNGDWDALSLGEERVTVRIDADGDGMFDDYQDLR